MSRENFGRFDGCVAALWLPDGRGMQLVEPFTYLDPRGKSWLAPAGSVVTGTSIPPSLWSWVGGPFEGQYRNASVLHDVACGEMREPWETVHQMFYEACRCGGVADRKAKMMYAAVYHFGPRWEVSPVSDRTTARPVKKFGAGPASTRDSAQPVAFDDDELRRMEDFSNEHNPSLVEFQRFKSCFISYTEADDAFSERLYNDLQGKGIRCWRWRDDAIWGGTLMREVDAAIDACDKLVVILSERSLQSEAVVREIERALQKEMREKKEVLFPIRLDDAIYVWQHALKADVLRKVIGNFCEWTDPAAYEAALKRLTQGLEASPAITQ